MAALQDMPAVVLTGMRQTGKSTLLTSAPPLAGRRYATLDDFAQLESARADPEGFLAGDEPLTIDEVQRAPQLLVAVKRAIDKDRRPGRFLLSGSANLSLLEGVSESLAGRAVYLSLRPFSVREVRGLTAEAPFLPRFFAEPRLPRAAASPLRADEVLAGGLPPVALRHVRDRSLWFRGFVQTYLERDVRDLAQVANLAAFRRLLQLTALRTGQLLNASELGRDAQLSASTAARWLGLLETSFTVTRLHPFLANRASRLIKAPKLYAGDAGLAAHLAGVDDLAQTAVEPLRGALFETYVAHSLGALLESHWPGASLSFWNIQGRHEVDFVVESARDTLAIEVKTASRWNDRDLKGLRAFLQQTSRCRAAILAYNGEHAAHLGEKLWAIPLGTLLS
ncbi:MAG TPA: ATP-binding protein [Myxococcales bacterium]